MTTHQSGTVGQPAGGSSRIGHSLPDSEPWKPSLPVSEHERVVRKLRAWEPLDGVAVLDDVSAVLDEVPPVSEELGEIAGRLSDWLGQLVAVATANGAADKSRYVAVLVGRAREVLAERTDGGVSVMRAAAVPDADRFAVRAARRLGWLASELLDELVAARCVKEAA